MIAPGTPYPHPGKFEGETYLTALAFRYTMEGCEDEAFGDVNEGGYYCRIDFGPKYGDKFYRQDEQGFFSEINYEEFSTAHEEHMQFAEALL